MSRPQRRSQQGFTLLEMLVVIVIAGVIVGFIAQGISSYDRARRAAQMGAQMDVVVAALEAFGTRYRALLVVGGAVPG